MRWSEVRWPRWGLAAVLCVGGLVAGCGGSSDDAGSAPSIGGLERRFGGDRNEKLWVLPLDAYRGPSDSDLSYARDLSIRACMAEKGFSFAIAPYLPVEAANVSPSGRKLFDREIAAQLGYGGELTKGLAEAQAFQREPMVGEELRAYNGQTDPDVAPEGPPRGCLGKASRSVPAPDIGLISSLEVAAYEKAKRSEVVERDRQKWAACLEQAGFAGLPDRPQNMPGDENRRRFGLGDDDTAPRSSPGRAELALAKADARCREKSGYTAALYRAEFDAQAAIDGRQRGRAGASPRTEPTGCVAGEAAHEQVRWWLIVPAVAPNRARGSGVGRRDGIDGRRVDGRTALPVAPAARSIGPAPRAGVDVRERPVGVARGRGAHPSRVRARGKGEGGAQRRCRRHGRHR